MTITIPHEVVERHILGEVNLICAWREYKRFSHQDVAGKMGISQSAYSQMEKSDANLRQSTITRLAPALEILPEQLSI